MTTTSDLTRQRIRVRGIVQGVGFRPFIARLAAETGITGTCLNNDQGVVIEAQGSADALAQLRQRLLQEQPPLAAILDVHVESAPVDPHDTDFVIAPSAQVGGERTLVPPDTATCADCLAEMHDRNDRRYRHPFITCTNCGPRLTIITDLPYDRDATTMARFPLCTRCASEYADPHDRRYHAQPIACHDCGPTLRFESAGSVTTGAEPALAAAQKALRDGRIVAILGLGGIHLACDATNSEAVQRLRERKRRPAKPFALMCRDLTTAASVIGATSAVQDALTGPQRPIVLATRRTSPKITIADQVAPGLDELGVMLPYTPVHELLFTDHPEAGGAAPPVLVMTSGNLSEEPLVYDAQLAQARLGGIADDFLLHDRPIHVPCEDSVVAISGDDVVPLRRSRGYAPLPVVLPTSGPVVLAVGAEIKNTFTLARGDLAFCSAHIGDMGTLESQEAFARSVQQLLALHDAHPHMVAADLHPGYASSRWAQRYADTHDLPLHLVQHHHAHFASLLAEHGLVNEAALGVTFDGTGYGCDGGIWGGEILHSPGDVSAMERVTHLRPFPLIGGELAVRTPARIAVALLHGCGLLTDGVAVSGLSPAEMALVTSQLRHGLGSPTTSVGRLFDGVAALLGVRAHVSYEAQAAIELEVLARTGEHDDVIPLQMPYSAGELDWRPLVTELVQALHAGADPAALARGFHDALAGATAHAVTEIGAATGVNTVGLSGGVMVNHRLRKTLQSQLIQSGMRVVTHATVPAGDGGLSLGQAVIARAITARTERPQPKIVAPTATPHNAVSQRKSSCA